MDQRPWCSQLLLIIINHYSTACDGFYLGRVDWVQYHGSLGECSSLYLSSMWQQVV